MSLHRLTIENGMIDSMLLGTYSNSNAMTDTLNLLYCLHGPTASKFWNYYITAGSECLCANYSGNCTFCD